MPHLLSLIDDTRLLHSATLASIQALCAAKLATATICIPAIFIPQANTDLPIATVANFPSGDAPLVSTLAEIYAATGAAEIDVVLPYRAWLAGRFNACRHYISQCKAACGNKQLKVILETGELKTPSVIEAASLAMCEAGADFIKTSTGNTPVGATLAAASAILNALKQFKARTGHTVGFKVSGGVRTRAQATGYVTLAADIMGEHFIHPSTFRIGSSSLAKRCSAF